MVQRLSADDLKKVCPPRMMACSVPVQTNGVLARERESDGADRRYLAAVRPLKTSEQARGSCNELKTSGAQCITRECSRCTNVSLFLAGGAARA